MSIDKSVDDDYEMEFAVHHEQPSSSKTSREGPLTSSDFVCHKVVSLSQCKVSNISSKSQDSEITSPSSPNPILKSRQKVLSAIIPKPDSGNGARRAAKGKLYWRLLTTYI